MEEKKEISIQSLIGVVNTYSDKDIDELKHTLDRMFQGVVDTAHKNLNAGVSVQGQGQ